MLGLALCQWKTVISSSTAMENEFPILDNLNSLAYFSVTSASATHTDAF